MTGRTPAQTSVRSTPDPGEYAQQVKRGDWGPGNVRHPACLPSGLETEEHCAKLLRFNLKRLVKEQPPSLENEEELQDPLGLER